MARPGNKPAESDALPEELFRHLTSGRSSDENGFSWLNSCLPMYFCRSTTYSKTGAAEQSSETCETEMDHRIYVETMSTPGGDFYGI